MIPDDPIRDRELARRILSKPDWYPQELKSAIPKILQLDPLYKVLLKQLPDLNDPVTAILLAGGYITSSALAPYLTSSTAAATYETLTHAAATYETSAHASATYETSAHAAATYETSAHAAATYETTAHAAATYQTITGATTFLTDRNTSTVAVTGTGGTSLGLSVVLAASSVYIFEMVGNFSGDTALTSLQLWPHYTGTINDVGMNYNYAGTRASWTSHLDALDGANPANIPSTATNLPVDVRGFIRTNASGTFSLQGAAVGGGTFTFQIGLSLRVQKIA